MQLSRNQGRGTTGTPDAKDLATRAHTASTYQALLQQETAT